MRGLLWLAGGLVFLAGVQLFVFPERTEEYFAWTIDVPLTAAFLGAAYWASVAFEWLAARETTWAYARIAVPSVFVFTTLTLVATLVHLELFHLSAEFAPATRAVTLAWIAIYSSVPVLMVVVMMGQRRAAGTDPPRTSMLPGWVRSLFAVHAAVMLVLGAFLFVSPERGAELWPWPLTPLTGRAVGAWVFSLGLAAAHCLWENDARRLRVAAGSYVVLGLLEGIALARYLDAVNWSEIQSSIYVVFLTSMVLAGVALLTNRYAGRSR
jgi:hypothetical protein